MLAIHGSKTTISSRLPDSLAAGIEYRCAQEMARVRTRTAWQRFLHLPLHSGVRGEARRTAAALLVNRLSLLPTGIELGVGLFSFRSKAVGTDPYDTYSTSSHILLHELFAIVDTVITRLLQ